MHSVQETPGWKTVLVLKEHSLFSFNHNPMSYRLLGSFFKQMSPQVREANSFIQCFTTRKWQGQTWGQVLWLTMNPLLFFCTRLEGVSRYKEWSIFLWLSILLIIISKTKGAISLLISITRSLRCGVKPGQSSPLPTVAPRETFVGGRLELLLEEQLETVTRTIVLVSGLFNVKNMKLE